MTEFGFTCTGVRADQYAAGPTLVFRLAITATEQTRIHALALRCQIRIEPARRGYGPVEAEGLADLFGERSRWGNTLLPVQFAQVTLMVPSFTGSTEIDLVVPCTYDMDIAASRYLGALEDGEAPLLMLFSGTAFTGAGGFHVEPVPWDREASYRMPVAVWQEMIEQHFPGCGWLRLPRDTLDELLAYRSRHALASWEATVRALLDAAAVPAAAADAKPSPQERFRAGALPPRTAQRTVAP
ncbi:DUF6084 family protein [Streptomyces sp. NPDC048272]|uniref:DUF6084 family protein n=1 Tax=Streptomyces sp. NPDC048272 TaxID=3154616 RepID=UPI0034288444